MRAYQVVMDGVLKFDSISAAAEWLIEYEFNGIGVKTTVLTNISHVVDMPNKSAYGHKWNKLTTYQNVDEHARQLKQLARDLYCQLLNAYNPKEIEEFANRMRELKISVPIMEDADEYNEEGTDASASKGVESD